MRTQHSLRGHSPLCHHSHRCTPQGWARRELQAERGPHGICRVGGQHARRQCRWGAIFLDDELAMIHFRRASSEAVQDDMMWSRLPQPLNLLGMPRPPRPPRLVLPRPPCNPRPAATNAYIGRGGLGPPGAVTSSLGSSFSMFYARWRMVAMTLSADKRSFASNTKCLAWPTGNSD
jgi:hypothetical protein